MFFVKNICFNLKEREKKIELRLRNFEEQAEPFPDQL
jgi:hypothetical protein